MLLTHKYRNKDGLKLPNHLVTGIGANFKSEKQKTNGQL